MVLVTLLVALAGMLGGPLPADASAACYRWNRTLAPGANGSDVRELQIRVAGWMGDRQALGIDGSYGPGTAAAVRRFQAGYGLPATGVAAHRTFAQIYALQDSDCTPAHFSYSEFASRDGVGFNGGRVGAAVTRRNAFRLMWRLEALRHKLGGRELIVDSGFRSVGRNRAVGGVSGSQHLYGSGADLVSKTIPLCSIVARARTSGLSGILGPGAEGHADHVHVDIRIENNDDTIANRFYWDFSRCR